MKYASGDTEWTCKSVFVTTRSTNQTMDLWIFPNKYLITFNLESWRFTTTLTKLWRVMVPGHRSENHSSSSSGWFWQRWTNTQTAGMEDGRGVYQKHKTRQVRAHAHKQTERIVGEGGGRHPRILPSFSSVWWILEGFLRPDRHLPSRLKKFSSSSRPYSTALPSDSFTALVNLTWMYRKDLNQGHEI